MKKGLRIITLALSLIIVNKGDSQVLISILFGDALNTPNIEFGLVGGDNISYFTDVPGSKAMGNFNIGFYFHILLKENSYLSTGVLVKSNVGATGMPTYSIGDAAFDSIYASGTLTKKINYFYVPILFQQRFNDNRWYLEGGFQIGLRNKANDIFDQSAFNGDLSYSTNVRDDYKHFDVGLMGGAGFKFKKQIKSMALGVNYYYGLMNVNAVSDTQIRNASAYIYLKIPIGANAEKSAAKAKAKADKKAAKEAEKTNKKN